MGKLKATNALVVSGTTSGGEPLGPVRQTPILMLFTVASMLSIPVTCNAVPHEIGTIKLNPNSLTSSGFIIPRRRETATLISEIRRLSGLTWDQLTQIFKVDRRSLHFWASGKSLAPENAALLSEVHNTIQKIDRGSVKVNRDLLLTKTNKGTPFDLLVDQKFDEVIDILGIKTNTIARSSGALALQEKAMRRPSMPATLVGAMQETIHQESGKLIAVTSVKPITEA